MESVESTSQFNDKLGTIDPTVKAAMMRAVRQPLSVGDAPVPSIAPDEVLIETRTCGICGTDFTSSKVMAMCLLFLTFLDTSRPAS